MLPHVGEHGTPIYCWDSPHWRALCLFPEKRFIWTTRYLSGQHSRSRIILLIPMDFVSFGMTPIWPCPPSPRILRWPLITERWLEWWRAGRKEHGTLASCCRRSPWFWAHTTSPNDSLHLL